MRKFIFAFLFIIAGLSYLFEIDELLIKKFAFFNDFKTTYIDKAINFSTTIEKHLDQSFYNVVKELKGGFSAFYWNQLSKRFGYDLKDQYRPGADPVMDAVLEDFDIKKDL